MANLTITVDDETLKKARMRALEEDTSVNAVLREYLEEYAGRRRERREAGRRLLELAEGSCMSSEGKGLPGRDDLHDRKITRGRSAGPIQ
ncbi:MAG: hypothetical protein IRY88_16820 [Rubrobacteraceae bacterium]|nr:hypothetical protein [Rubrobacteraceae bacterium]